MIRRPSPKLQFENSILDSIKSQATLRAALVLLLTAFVGGILAKPIAADVKLPKVIGSHMVLQRDMPIHVWGWAEAGEEVSVTLGHAKAATKADEKGKWSVKLPPS